MRRRLALDDANDVQSHFQRIERLAVQGGGQTVLRHESDKGRFFLHGKDGTGKVWVQHEVSARPGASHRDGPLRKAILPDLANAWWFDGEAPVQVVEGAEVPYPEWVRVVWQLEGGEALSQAARAGEQIYDRNGNTETHDRLKVES